jgi:4-hydroxybenzoate polyprenyltransferase
VYLMNDWLDRERDRAHPEKRHRPIAAGLLGGPLVSATLVTLWLGGGALALWIGPAFATTALAYLVLQLLYSFWLKHTVLLDVLAIAFGFVIRVYAGGAAIAVEVSSWLFLCTLLLALFLGFAKRRQELASLSEHAAGHRQTLSHYSLSLLDQLIAICAGACIVCYGLYTVESQTARGIGPGRLSVTVPLVVYGMFRYLYLVHQRGEGGSPEKVLLSDRPLLVTVALFTALTGWALYG